MIWCHAPAREFTGWRDTSDGALALILLLDQFTRNLYRGTVEAYAGDPSAFEIVNHAIDQGLDRALHPVAMIWLYHPFHHSEDVAEQDRGLGLLRALRQHANPAWHAYMAHALNCPLTSAMRFTIAGSFSSAPRFSDGQRRLRPRTVSWRHHAGKGQEAAVLRSGKPGRRAATYSATPADLKTRLLRDLPNRS